MVRAAAFLLRSVLDILLPPLCPLCRSGAPEEGSPFCRPCRTRFVRLEEPYCTRCGTPFEGAGPSHPCGRCLGDDPPFRELRAWGLYRGGLLEAVHRIKYGRDLQLRSALQVLAEEALDRYWGETDFSAVVPVPCHPATLRARGFDLPALLARHLSRRRSVPWRPKALRKVRKTPDLVALGYRERASAVAGAYQARDSMEGAVLLVDDVATSTSTARVCARACLEAGASAVSVLVLARTPLADARR